MTTTQGGQAAPGWYDDGTGHQRWWDGQQWGPYAPPAQPAPQEKTKSRGPMTASQVNVRRESIYTRQQTGHSLTAFILIDWITLYIRTIYYSVSPNHYWHA
jgi:hypothetical protein